MIDIIIPCYNAHSTIEKTLNSIIVQSIKDKAKVLLVDDASDKGYESVVSKYKEYIDISLLILKDNVGPGLAREKGIQHTKSKYIMFIDSDDLLMNVYSLELLYKNIEEGYDYVITEHYNEKTGVVSVNSGDLHGKIYRRKYIEDNNVHFNATRVHEDNYFNNYVFISGANFKRIDICTYYYVYNNESITNREDLEVDRLEIYFKNCNELIDIAKKNNYSEIRLNAFMGIKYAYINKLYNEVSGEKKKLLDNLVKKYVPDFEKYRGLKYEACVYKLLKENKVLEK
jgi:glycosyltransferase involved in cell wall biosynthesis